GRGRRGSWPGSGEPDRGAGRLKGPVHGGEQVALDGVEVHGVLQPGGEGGYGAVGVVAGPVEPAVHDPLHPPPHRAEQGGGGRPGEPEAARAGDRRHGVPRAPVAGLGCNALRSGGTRTPNTSRSAVSAASSPQRPCTAGPGGVAAEHRYTPRSGVRYGFHRISGRAGTWRTVCAPQAMSPPT